MATVAACIFVVVWSFCVYSEKEFRGISEEVLRLHVLANSDSAADQALKLKVRDCVLAASETLLSDCKTREEAKARIAENTEVLSRAAAVCIGEEGYDYPVSVRLEEVYFPTRDYEGGSLPAGVYQALRVEIGEAAGRNWWCVLFPKLCFVNARVPENTAAPEAEATETPVRLPEKVETNRVTVRFKVIDLFQKTKQEIKSFWAWFT
jgi:stage II sporulation protein R